MPRKVPLRPLTDKVRKKLKAIQRTAQSTAEFSRARTIALLSAGWSVKDVAEAMDVSTATVTVWNRRFRKEGADGLRDRPRSGRPPIYGELFRNLLRRYLGRRPKAWGLTVTVWTVLSLASVLSVRTRRWISPTHLRRILHEEGYSWRRPRLSLRHRQNRRLYKSVQRRLQALEKQARRPGADFVLLYGDETEFHLNPELTGMWARKGVPFEIPSAGQDRKVMGFGAVDYASGRLVWRLAERKNQHEFCAFIQQVLRAFRGRKIVLVLDNVAYHKTKMLLDLYAEHRDRLDVVWLPPYSPNLNRIERVWKHLKSRYIQNEFFETLQKLLRAIDVAFTETNSDLRLIKRVMVEPGRRRRAA